MVPIVAVLGLITHRELQEGPSSACIQAGWSMALQCPGTPFDDTFTPSKETMQSICSNSYCYNSFQAVIAECFDVDDVTIAVTQSLCTGTCGTAVARECNSRCDVCLFETFTTGQVVTPSCASSCLACTPYFHCPVNLPCFPGDALVTTPSGHMRVSELEVDDVILVRTMDGASEYQRVSPLSIALNKVVPTTLLRVNSTDGKSIVMSAEHRLVTGKECCANFARASDIVVGDAVHSRHDVHMVTSVEGVIPQSSGLYSPVLVGGGLPIIDDVVTSPGSEYEMTALEWFGGMLHSNGVFVDIFASFLRHDHPTLLNQRAWKDEVRTEFTG